MDVGVTRLTVQSHVALWNVTTATCLQNICLHDSGNCLGRSPVNALPVSVSVHMSPQHVPYMEQPIATDSPRSV